MTIAIGQTDKDEQGSNSQATAQLGTTQTSGSTFLAFFWWDNNNGGAVNWSTLADTIGGSASGNTWTQIGTEQSSSQLSARAYYVSAGFNGGATHNVVVTLDGSTFISFIVFEVTGADTADLLSGTPVLTSDGSSPYDSGNVTTVDDATMLIGMFGGQSGSNPATHAVSGTSNPTAGWTLPAATEVTDGTQFETGCFAYQRVTATGTYHAAFTETGGGGSLPGLVAFKEFVVLGPTIDTQPSDASEFNNFTTQFTVAATASAGSLTYQWQVSTDYCISFSNVSDGSGGTTDTYTTHTLTFADEQTFYRCAVTDSNGTVNTRGASLRIKPKSDLAWTVA